jgi:hypothetical protein
MCARGAALTRATPCRRDVSAEAGAGEATRLDEADKSRRLV